MAYLIDIEGIDGSGKGTQARLICDRFDNAGYKSALVSFPRYDATLFGRAVGEFLNGRFGTLEQVHPFLVSLLFAGDRYESKQFLLDALCVNDVVVLDRYVPSNVAHQACKLDGAERAELTRRILHIEFEIFGLPRPDMVLLLELPVANATELIARKAARTYTTAAADIQEADSSYLARVRDVYLELAQSQPDWQVVTCCQGNRLRSVQEIGDEIWELVRNLKH